MKRLAVVFLSMFMIASVAGAQGHGGGPQGERAGGPGAEGGPGHALVGTDGTIYIPTVTVDSTANTASTKIVAVHPSGATAWTATLNTAAHLTLSGTNLIAESSTRATDGTVTTTLTAISTASGSTVWTKTIPGRVELVPFSGGTYAFVNNGGTRSLVGIGNDGSTLFTLAL